MKPDKIRASSEISVPEERFLDRLSQKYETSETAGQLRSYLIASIVLLVLFVISRFIPWSGAALLLAEALGLTLFHKYKRFANFKSRILRKLWQAHNKSGTQSA